MRRNYQIVSFFDTETCNLLDGCDTVAYSILYIVNEIKAPVELYQVNRDDNIIYYRYYNEMLLYIIHMVNDYKQLNCVPVIVCYNLLFDIKSLMYSLRQIYDIKVLGKSTTNLYFIDLYEDGKQVLRFWDMFYLDMRGVSALGAACGLPKLNGDWDYDLIRTPETPLTTQELGYAARDVQVLPCYLNWLMSNNPNIKPDSLANTCLTKTSIVRLDAKQTIGKKKPGKYTLLQKFNIECLQEAPQDYAIYKLRTTCFRGGLTFTSANCAHKIYSNVTSLDVTSMHHAFINGSMIGTKYKPIKGVMQDMYITQVIYTPIDYVLQNYDKPFKVAFNTCIIFENIRLKEHTVYERLCIACLAETRFKNRKQITDKIQEECEAPIFTFSKLIKAGKAKVYVTEYELFNISLVYEWDSYQVLTMEGTTKFTLPPAYISLQSNKLFNQKNICKKALKGNITDENISFMPITYQEQIKAGNLDTEDFNVYYINTIKGMFNGIYGTQAMNPVKDGYIIDENGNILIDESTRPTEENYSELNPKWDKILYTYGTRIVGRSRTHLLLAMYLLDLYFDRRIMILAGDTDSLKIACDDTVTDTEIMQALEPLHNAITASINKVQERYRELYPEFTSTLKNVGCFEIETSEAERYKYHMEYWNKARITIDKADKVHLTFAGLPTKGKGITIIDVLQKVYDKYGVKACFEVLGYNVEICEEISHTLEHKIPKSEEKLNREVTDYQGNTCNLNLYQCIALYPTSRVIGSTMSIVNKENVEYLKNRGLNIDTCIKELTLKDNHAVYCNRGIEVFNIDMED